MVTRVTTLEFTVDPENYDEDATERDILLVEELNAENDRTYFEELDSGDDIKETITAEVVG